MGYGVRYYVAVAVVGAALAGMLAFGLAFMMLT